LIGGLQPPKGQETGGGHFSNLALLVHPIWLPIILKRSTPQVDLPTERKNLLFSLICWHGCTPLATPDSRCQRGGSLLSLRKPFHVKLRRGPHRILEACMHAWLTMVGRWWEREITRAQKLSIVSLFSFAFVYAFMVSNWKIWVLIIHIDNWKKIVAVCKI
jgi:hypothetical protein